MGKKIAIIVLLIILGLGIYINGQSDEFVVTRSLLMEAPADRVFAQVNNYKNWENWSPWAHLDPNQKMEYTGADMGVGAVMYWNGNKDVGEGKSTIVESRRPEFIKTKLEFIKPFKSESIAEFSFEPKGNQTMVTWTMLGKKNFVMKAMSLVMDCDAMAGAQFEEGLANLRKTVQ